MTLKALATGVGQILYHEGDLDKVYGIASLSKIWASVLIHERIQQLARERKVSMDTILDETFKIDCDYGSLTYDRLEMRPDLKDPDDPHSYKPFRVEKIQFCIPLKKGEPYRIRDLFEAVLFQSKNDAIQALSDHFFAFDGNQTFREASKNMAKRLGLLRTRIGDPHGLCDGDNTSTGRDLIAFSAAIIEEGHMDFFTRFKPHAQNNMATEFLSNTLLVQYNVSVLIAKTATGNNRQGSDFARSLLVVANVKDEIRITLVLSDPDIFASTLEMLTLDRYRTNSSS